ncbi:ABC transporter substrate-binding protein [Actinokineospora soli]|uniref:ABC transporter substrate-binding protein n=1 Tax=Actinokineospora soli TaxID=1048753 RepID=A0ABW2TQC0_9PSEU
MFEERLALAKQALPDVQVDLVQIPEDYDTKLQTMIAGGDAPDVMMVAEAVNVLSSKGQLVDLNPALAEAGVDPVATFGQATVGTYSTDGKLWAAPDRSGAMAVYYNKAIFDKQGVAYPDASWDWADFRQAANKLTVREGDKVTSWGFAAGDWWPWYMTWMKQNGGRVLDDAGKPVVDSPENAEALEFYHSLVHKDRVAPSPVDYADAGLDDGQADPLFSQGKLAMFTTGFWNVATLSKSDLDWGVAPLWHGKQEAVPAFGAALAVSSQSEHKDAATKLVTFLTSDEGQQPLVTSGLDVPANLAVANSPAFQQPAWNTEKVDLSAFTPPAAAVYLPPLVPEWNAIQKAFTDGMDATWKGKASVRDGLAAVQRNLEGVLR